MYPEYTLNINTDVQNYLIREALIKDMKDILLMYYELTYSTNFVKKETARIDL